MSGTKPETLFKRFIADSFKGFVSRVEYGLGGDAGFSDLVLGTSSGLLPAELKCGKLDDGFLWTSEIRPAQIAWHRELSEYGFPSIFLVGIQTPKSWRTFVFNGVLAPNYDTIGFKIGVDCFELPCQDLASEIDEFLFREFGA